MASCHERHSTQHRAVTSTMAISRDEYAQEVLDMNIEELSMRYVVTGRSVGSSKDVFELNTVDTSTSSAVPSDAGTYQHPLERGSLDVTAKDVDGVFCGTSVRQKCETEMQDVYLKNTLQFCSRETYVIHGHASNNSLSAPTHMHREFAWKLCKEQGDKRRFYA